MAKEKELDVLDSSYLHLLSAFLAMEPPNVVISFARSISATKTSHVILFSYFHLTKSKSLLTQGIVAEIQLLKQCRTSFGVTVLARL